MTSQRHMWRSYTFSTLRFEPRILHLTSNDLLQRSARWHSVVVVRIRQFCRTDEIEEAQHQPRRGDAGDSWPLRSGEADLRASRRERKAAPLACVSEAF